MSKSRMAQFFILGALCVGFHVFEGRNSWWSDRTDPTIWLRSCREPTVTKNDLPSNDPLAGAVPTYAQAMNSIIDDYNGIKTSFIRLAVYPVDPVNPGTPLPGDSTFTIAKGTVRTIDICFGQQTLTAGHATPTHVDGHITNCKIQLSEKDADNAKNIVRVLTHELGHCLGLAHVQETTKSVMSYYAGSDLIRLQDDDKMAMTYLYPEDPSYAEETPTMGLSCQTR